MRQKKEKRWYEWTAEAKNPAAELKNNKNDFALRAAEIIFSSLQ